MDVKFNTFFQGTRALANLHSQNNVELDTIMQPYVDRFNNGEITEKELAEVRKREANILANKKEVQRQEQEEKRKIEAQTTAKTTTKKPEEKKPKIQNNNPLYNSFRPDVKLDKQGNDFFNLEEKDAKGRLDTKFKNTNISFEKTNIAIGTKNPDDIREGFFSDISTLVDDTADSYRKSRDAIKVVAKDDNGNVIATELIELDVQGMLQPKEGWDAIKVKNYNKLANFLDEHLSEESKQLVLQNSEDIAEILKKTEENILEPTEQEYVDQINKKQITSIDIFDEKEDFVATPGGGMPITQEFGGYEEEIKEARTQLIKERKNAANVSDMPYKGPTIDEVKERALLNLQNKEKRYVRQEKYDEYLNDIEKFSRGLGLDINREIEQLAEEQGIKKTGPLGITQEYVDFAQSVKDSYKEKYYSLKQAGADEEANAILDYKKNEVALKISVDKLTVSDAYKRFNETNVNINDLNHVYPRAEQEVKLENGKIIPLDIWEQHMRDHAELQPILEEVQNSMLVADKSIKTIKDRNFQWDMIKRNYNDFERTQEILGYGFANIGVGTIYGIPKLLSFGYAEGGISDDEMIRIKEYNARVRNSFRKDVDFDRAFEDGNFGRFMGQAAVDQIPIYATIATGNVGLGILGASVFGDKWAEMTMEERYSNGLINHPKWKKWFMSLGYGASEIVLDYAITVPIMRNAKLAMMGGTGKALVDNSSNAFFRKFTARSLVYSPLLEGISEGSTQIAQNMIDGKNILENLDHAAFLGLTMGFGIGGGGFVVGAINSQFSDHKTFKTVREKLTEMQELQKSIDDLNLYKNEKGVDTKKAEQEIKNQEKRRDELLDEANDLIKTIHSDVKDLEENAYNAFLDHINYQEQLKIRAKEILEGNLPEVQKQKQLGVLLTMFNDSKSAANEFKDPKTFGSRWPLIRADKSEEGKKRYNDLIKESKRILKEDGVLDADEKQIDKKAKEIWAKEEVRKSNEVFKRNNLSKNYNYFETMEDGVKEINKQIQEEIDFYNKKLQDGVEEVVMDGEKIKVKEIIDGLVEERKILSSNIRSGKMYGLTRIDKRDMSSKSISIVETQARAERFETRVHEGAHQAFWDALMLDDNSAQFEPMAEQILEWTKKNDERLYKRILLKTQGQSASEIVAVFVEEVADSGFTTESKRNFANLWGLMANKTMYDIYGEKVDFSGETNAVKFLAGLSKKIKEGKLVKKDIQSIRRSELLKSFAGIKNAKGKKTMFSRDVINPKAKEYLEAKIDGELIYTNESLVDIINAKTSSQEERFAAVEALIEKNWPVISKSLKFNPTGNISMPSIKEAIAEQMLGIFPRVILADGSKINREGKRLLDTYNKEQKVTTFLDATLRPRQAEILVRASAIDSITENVDLSEAKDVKAPEPTTTTTQQRVVIKEKVVLETFGEKALQNEIRGNVVGIGISGINKYIDVKKAITDHKKFTKDGTEITPEYKAAQKKLEKAAVEKYKKQGFTEKEAKKQAKKDHGVVELKSLREPKGMYYPILEKIAAVYGVDPLRLIREQDFDTKQRKSAQDYILSKRDEHIVSIPEGTTRAGDPTGIANTIIGREFFKAGGRMKFKTTGTGKGLKEQAKQRIEPMDYLAIFGLIPKARVNNSSVDPALRSQIISTATIAINQAVRQEKDALNLTKERIDRIKDGKGSVMFSSDNDATNFKKTYQITLTELSKIIGYRRIPMITKTRKSGKTGELKEYSTRDLNAPLVINGKETGETILNGATRVVNEFVKENPEFRNLLRSTLTGGYNAGLFLYAERDSKTPINAPVFDELIDNVEAEQVAGRKKYTTDKFVRAGFNQDFLKNYDALTENQKLDFLYKFFKSVEKHLKNKPNDAWLFIELIRDTSKSQNTLTRILAPFKFYPRYKDGSVISDQKVTEEHTDPQNLIGKSLLAAALVGKVDFVWQVIGKSYMQGPLLDSKKYPHDTIVNKAGYKETMPDVYYELVVPRILNGELKLPNGYASIVRLAVAVHPDTRQQIDLGMYYLPESNMTITEFFKVDNVESIEQQNELIVKQLTGEVDAMFSRDFGSIGLNPVTQQGKQLDKAVMFSRETFDKFQAQKQKGKEFVKSIKPQLKQSRGITVLDFDDTLATTKSLVRFTTPDGETGTLNAEQYASTYVDLLDQGYVFDFSEFNKVVKGKIAPLFQKALKLQKKFGPENMFVLTARPPAAQKAIFDFLKANGLNIPLKNITGLGNSTAEAKALWIADKVGDGYNDFYFADDALQNVQAVDNMLEQFDVKRKVQQAKLMFSRDMDTNFNDILESVTGIESIKEFSKTQAEIRGKSSKYKSIIPPSAQDFMGLIYNFIGKGKRGDADLAFFKKALVDPFARGINELNTSRQRAANDLQNLNKKLPEVKKKLYKKVKGTNFTNDQAMRVYLWNKAGFEVPGLSKRDQKTLVEAVENDSKLKAYAEAVSLISKQENVYREPKEYWLSENIASDLLDDGAVGDARSNFIAEWIENKNVIFSPKNLNKIEAIYGSKFREALEDVLYAMETGRSRPRDGGRLLNMYTNWVNNSVGAIMFFNMRSALLQTISMTNYINWSDNNPLKAAAAFANQKQYWKDFTFIFNSDFLKQRRTGNRRGINEQELSAAVAGSDNKAKAAIAWLLSKGFLPTQIADSFAIASGGATFYRNRIKKYLKEGMTQEQAEKKAFLDFQEVTEVSQQSARPDMISQQQRSPLGRLILAFGNTPMQYARIMNKAARDLVNGRGDYKTHISKIAYYGFIQSVIFSALQSALFASLGDDKEEDFNKKKERILNQIVDSMLTGIGFGGKAISTVKNTIITFLDQRDRGFRADHAYTLLQLLSFSPPIGSKLRKVYSSIKTDQYNKDVYMRRGFTLDNPIWQAIGNVVEGITNLPLGRMSNKMLNIDNALDESNKWWQRAALLLGWNTWDLGIRDPDIEEIKEEVKKEKKQASKIKAEIKRKEKQIEKQEAEKAIVEENKKKSEKDGRCAAISGSGKRCKNKAVSGGFCTIHEKVEARKDGKQVQCSATKSNGKRCKMKTTNKSGRCYYHD